MLCALASLGAGCSSAPEQPSIVLVVLDTLRNDHVGASTTPRLDTLAAESTVFTRAFSTAPWTVPSHASMFTGLLPSEHHCHNQHLRLPADTTTLAELLRDAGYQTAAFYSNYWLSDDAAALLRGFDVARRAGFQSAGTDGVKPWSGDQGGRGTLRSFAEWLDERAPDAPFFAFVNFLECHLPYDPSPAVRRKRLSDLPSDRRVSIGWAFEFNADLYDPASVDWRQLRRLYAADVETTDRLLANLLALLQDAGLGDDTILIVTSDHGENLGDHDLAEHQFSVHETLLAVPLIIRAPGVIPAGKRNDPVMLTDLFATILDLAAVDGHPTPRHSRSLVSGTIPAQRALVAEYQHPGKALLGLIAQCNPDLDLSRLGRALSTIRSGDLRATTASDGSVALHDLAVDPQQLHDLSDQRPEDLDRLLKLLADAVPERGRPNEKVKLSPEARKRLRSLGYVH